ncbi:MAG: endonuclease/exonuclease/phosphatase family protein [Lunatimonas sp.]|nr:endonuclease/exonuclease/phosphatase family protein [Lunatimonas sp.]
MIFSFITRMSILFTVGLVVFLWVLGGSPLFAQEISVLSYNIHHCNPPSKPGFIDVEAIAKVIRESGADLVALQEVDVYTERSGKSLHQAEKLGELTGMYWYFYKSIDHAGGEYGNALLSKFPISAKGGFSLPNDPDTEPRTAVFIDIELPGGKEITFAGTHLEFKREEVTLRQAKAIVAFFEDRSPKPIILAGDFNAEVTMSPMVYLDSHFQRPCTENCAPTIPQVNPQKEIDFVMVKPKEAFVVTSHEVINESYASDHLPVLVNFQVNK